MRATLLAVIGCVGCTELAVPPRATRDPSSEMAPVPPPGQPGPPDESLRPVERPRALDEPAPDTAVREGARPTEPRRDVQWDVEVLYPDAERRQFLVTGAVQELPLRSRKWRCWLTAREDEQTPRWENQRTSIRCHDGTTWVMTGTSCTDGRTARGDVAILSIEEKAGVHAIALTCKNF